MFESDRSGSQQLYVMNADGSGERRISFGKAAVCVARLESRTGNGSPSPSAGRTGRRIGIIKPDGTGETMLTAGPGR